MYRGVCSTELLSSLCSLSILKFLFKMIFSLAHVMPCVCACVAAVVTLHCCCRGNDEHTLAYIEHLRGSCNGRRGCQESSAATAQKYKQDTRNWRFLVSHVWTYMLYFLIYSNRLLLQFFVVAMRVLFLTESVCVIITMRTARDVHHLCHVCPCVVDVVLTHKHGTKVCGKLSSLRSVVGTGFGFF